MGLMETLFRDLRYSIRLLFKNPGYSVVAILTLALGIGVTTAVFSVVNAVLLRPLPYQDPNRLMMIYEARQQNEGYLSVPDFISYQEQNEAFEQMAVSWSENFNLATGDKPETLPGELVSANFFSTLNVAPAMGRAFVPGDDKTNGSHIVVITYGLWQRRFGADPGLLGKTLLLNGANFTVVGIMPRSFQPLNRETELWIPLDLDGGDALRLPASLPHNNVKVRKLRFLSGIARLKQNVSLEQARANLETISRILEQQYPDTNLGWRGVVSPLYQRLVGDIRPSLLILLGAVAFVLIIACTNVANLMLVRSVSRQKEMAVRIALGASPPRLVRQLFTESTVLALCGGVVGLLLAYLGISFLLAVGAGFIPRLETVSLDMRVLGFTLAVTVLTGLLFGLIPALHFTKPDLQQMLKAGRLNATGDRKQQRFRSLFVIAEVTLSLVLLVSAGLMVKSLFYLHQVDPGFNPNRAVAMKLSLPKGAYPNESQQVAFFNSISEKIKALPGVRSVCAVNYLPLSGEGLMVPFDIEGSNPLPSGQKLYAAYNLISPDYFRTMDIPLRKGRVFSEQDDQNAARVVIISEAMARLYWPNEDPLGKHLTLSIGNSPPIKPEIIGIAGDVRQFGLDADSGAQIYEPYLQRPSANMNLVVRTASDPMPVVPSLLNTVLSVDRNQPVFSIRSMDKILTDSISQPHFVMLLLGIFALLALALAAIGIFGVISYSVTQRTQEIGIRIALGAQNRDIYKLIIRHGMGLTLVGMLIGVPCAYALTRLMSSLLFGLSAADPATYVASLFLMSLVALLACYLPARRATMVDPKIALSTE